MPLTDDDLNHITERLRPRKEDQMKQHFISLALSLCVAGILWILSGISEMKEELAGNAEWRKISISQMESFSEFMKEPRFTRSDFIIGIEPILQKMDAYDARLVEGDLFMSRVDKEVEMLKTELRIFKESSK